MFSWPLNQLAEQIKAMQSELAICTGDLTKEVRLNFLYRNCSVNLFYYAGACGCVLVGCFMQMTNVRYICSEIADNRCCS